jgi:aminobenzoyl-glutamate transport protein
MTIPVTWWVVERVVEPRVASMAIDGDPASMPTAPAMETREHRALWAAMGAAAVLMGAFAWAARPADSPFRSADGLLTGPGSPVMLALIPLLLVLTLVPSIVYGVVAGTLRSHRDAIEGMTSTMSSMGYYVVMVFFAAQFTRAFAESNIGALLALEGTRMLQTLGMPTAVMIVGVVALAALLDVVVPSASAKWALLAPILVPMLMGMGIAPELTQAAFRVGDGPVNLVTPLMPYFPLVLAFCRRYVSGFGLGSLMALVFPLGVTYIVMQTILLLVWWGFGLPLGVGGRYVFP